MPIRIQDAYQRAAFGRRVALGSVLFAAALAVPCDARAQTAMQTGASSTPAQIVGAFDKMFNGPHAGQRAVHAKGLLCAGVFTPAAEAVTLSRAAHLHGAPVPVLARFSNFAAVPGLPDGDPASSPRGLAVKFLLPDGEDTDIVAHSYNGFPAGTPTEFLAFLRAVTDPAALKIFAADHPAARSFLDDPKPAPASYGTETFFGVNAFHFTNAAGVSRYGRYRFIPVAGISHLSAEQAAKRTPSYLSEVLGEQLRRGPVAFRLVVQLAGEGDTVTDGSVPWPSDRPVVELGTLSLRAVVPDDDARQQELSFVPTNLVGGIAASADPMLTARTQAYRISAKRRFDAQ